MMAIKSRIMPALQFVLLRTAIFAQVFRPAAPVMLDMCWHKTIKPVIMIVESTNV